MILSWKTFSDLKMKSLGGYYMCLWCFLGKKKKSENNGMRGNIKTMGREKLLLALHSGHSFTTAER